MLLVSLENMRAAIQNWDCAWHTWVYADSHGGCLSFWNGQKHPNMYKLL